MPRSAQARRPIAEEPYVENYPPLRDWLHEQNARCAWQFMQGPKNAPTQAVEMWVAHGVEFVVTAKADRRGWNVYTPCHINSIAATLTDALARLKAAEGGGRMRSVAAYPKLDLVCFASAFAYESAPNITHLTLDGERTACGRRDWETTEGIYPGGPDCNVCRKTWDRLGLNEATVDS